MANYQNNIPAPADQLNDSQLEIQQNFLAIEDLINVDHANFAGGAGDEGKHLKVTLPENGRVALADAPVTAANETAIYCRQSTFLDPAGNNVSALFFRPEGQGAGIGTEYDFTTLTFNAAPAAATSGCFALPNGIKMAFGTGTITPGAPASYVDINFYNVVYFTADNTIYTIQITQTGIPDPGHHAQDNIVSVTNITRAGFRAVRNTNYVGSTVHFTYLAIGT